jgi:hypothetical protein
MKIRTGSAVLIGRLYRGEPRATTNIALSRRAKVETWQ